MDPTAIVSPTSRSVSTISTNQSSHDVHISVPTAELILAYAVLGAQLVSLELSSQAAQPETKVYCVTCRAPPRGDIKRYILKTCANDAGPAKMANEVHTLRLLQAKVPDLKVPRVMTWSGAGSTTSLLTPHQSWIFMTMLEGQPLDVTVDVDGKDLQSVFYDLAESLGTMRTLVSGPGGLGSLVDARGHGDQVILGPPVERPWLPGWPKATHLQYTRALLREGIAALKSLHEFTPHRDLFELLHRFVFETLPRLAIFQDTSLGRTAVLTHGDLSAKSLLVARPTPFQSADTYPTPPLARTPLRLTGIVGWEHAGFLPPMEEFLKAHPDFVGPTAQLGDRYARYLLPALDAYDVPTPFSIGARSGHWETAILLHQLVDKLSPWRIRGLDEGERIRDSDDKVGQIVRLIAQLEEGQRHSVGYV